MDNRVFDIFGYLNPLGKFVPARVVPIFREKGTSDNSLYIQQFDSSGKIHGFEEIHFENVRQLIHDPKADLVHVGKNFVFAFADCEEKFVCGFGYTMEKQYLRDFLSGTQSEASPLFSIEASRYIKDFEAEKKFVFLSALRLAKLNENAARNWVESGVFDESIRPEAIEVVAEYFKLEKTPNPGQRSIIAVDETLVFPAKGIDQVALLESLNKKGAKFKIIPISEWYLGGRSSPGIAVVPAKHLTRDLIDLLRFIDQHGTRILLIENDDHYAAPRLSGIDYDVTFAGDVEGVAKLIIEYGSG